MIHIDYFKLVRESHTPSWKGFKRAKIMYFVLYPVYKILSTIDSLFNYKLFMGSAGKHNFFRAMGFVESMHNLRKK